MFSLQTRQPQSNLGNKGDCQQGQEHCDQEGHYRNTESLYGNICNTAADKEIDANRRSQKSHGRANDHNNAKVNGIDTKHLDDRKNDS